MGLFTSDENVQTESKLYIPGPGSPITSLNESWNNETS